MGRYFVIRHSACHEQGYFRKRCFLILSISLIRLEKVSHQGQLLNRLLDVDIGQLGIEGAH